MELETLERVIKSQNEIMKNRYDEMDSSLNKIAKLHVKLEKKNKRLIEDNTKLYRKVKQLRVKLMLQRPQPEAHPDLEILAEAAINLDENTE